MSKKKLKKKKKIPSLYQYSCFVVNIVFIQVTLSVVRLDDPCDTPVQCDVGFSIGGEYQ